MCLSQHLRPDRQRPACLSKAMLLWLAGGADGNDKPEDEHCRRQRHSGAVVSHRRVPRSLTKRPSRCGICPPPTHNREPYDTLLYCLTSCPYRFVCGTDAACSSTRSVTQ